MIRSSAGWRREGSRWWRLALALTLLLALAGCAGTASETPFPATWTPMGRVGIGGGAPTTTPPSDLTPRPLPAFADWRLAYVGQDGRLRAVSLDGKTTSVGSMLGFRGVYGLGVWAAGASPNGRSLAYLSDGELTVVDAATGVQRSYLTHTGDSRVWWSPDQRYLALTNPGAVVVVNGANGSRVALPPSQGAAPQLQVSGPYGWLDATHVAVISLTASTATVALLQSLDVVTGALRPIATIQVDGGGAFAVQPGGAYTLFWNGQFRGDPFVPQVALINNATGAITPLPRLTSALSSYGYMTLLWRPNSAQALVGTLSSQTLGMSYALIDVARDTVTPLSLPGSPEAWSPDGAALIVATASQQPITEDAPGFNDIGAIGAGPFTLSAVSMDAQGHVGKANILTNQAMTIPLLGFVRTA